MGSGWIERQIEALLTQAGEAVMQLNWNVVSDRARAILALDPENADAKELIAAVGRALSSAEAAEPASSALSTTEVGPRSFANGRYEIKRFLGEGGKKKVYLARDTLLDREVAFALIKMEGLDEAGRLRTRHEAQAMGRLGSHPHIVTVFDLGQDEGQPYMVTEHMAGGDVEGLLEQAQDHRLPLDHVLRIARHVCAGLEYAHARGIIHRDLKPGNVWLSGSLIDPSAGSASSAVNPGGGAVAKIGDFGLAVAVDRSRLTQAGMMVGTVSYMPPEQALGAEVTPRSDLYSLGCMLYEMVCGRPPFLGDDPIAIISQHINASPVAPTWHNGKCPRPLEALILRLLAKDPAQRPGSATDVLNGLEGVQATGTAAEADSPGPPEDANALEHLSGGIFVGRQREMGELKAALEETLSGRGRLVTLVGEPGIGKTRTAEELSTYAALRGAQTLWGRCYEAQGVPPYWPWVQAIRSYVREREPERLRSEMGSGAPEIAEIVSDVRDRLPGLDAPAKAAEPEAARFRLFDSIAAFLRSASRSQPLVLVLDDLHWADKPSLLLLEFVAQELSGARLLVIGTYRDVDLSRQHPLAETLGELARGRLFQRVLLRGLTEEDVSRFVELATGGAPPEGLVQAVYTQTEGNPLFVTEVVRLLVQEGELTPERARSRQAWEVRIPEGVREVLGRRLNRLSQRCNQTLAIASVIGREFGLPQLRRLIDDLSEDRLLEVLEEASSARVIEELPRTAGRYQFTHALIQETLLEELSLTRRVRLHARIAEALEELYGAEADAHAAELASHFSQAETVLGNEKVVRYSRIAGERALATHAFEEALEHFKRALSAKEGPATGGPAPDADTADILFGLGRAQAATLAPTQLQESFGCLSRAFDYYVESGDVEQAIAAAAHPLFTARPGVVIGPVELLERALRLAPPGSLQEARLLSNFGLHIGRHAGDYARAQDAFQRAVAIAEREGDAALELQVLGYAASVDQAHGHHQSGLELCMRAIELARRVEDPLAEVLARTTAVWFLATTARFEESRVHAAAALEVAERLRNRSALADALWVNALCCLAGGDFAAVREYSDRGLQHYPKGGRLLALRAMLEYETGNFAEGETYLERVREQVVPIPSPSTSIVWGVYVGLVTAAARTTGVKVIEDGAMTLTHRAALERYPEYIGQLNAGLGLMATYRGDGAQAHAYYAQLVTRRGSMNPSLACSSFDRILGLLAQAFQDLDGAAAHFEDAVSLCEKGGHRPEEAWSAFDYAELLVQRGGPGDPDQAAALYDRALAISRELGMRPLMEQVLARRSILSA